MRIIISLYACCICLLILATQIQAEDPITFKKLVLSDKYYCDGIDTGDINQDGNIDIVAGPFWYAGPSFQQKQAFYSPVELDPEPSPSDSMFSFVQDLSGDGWPDIIVLGRVHKHAAYWYENPKSQDTPWKKHFMFERVRGESPAVTDLNNDGIVELICHWDGQWGFIQPHKTEPRRPWQFTPVGENLDWPQFYHGTGTGDINNDGRPDIIINDGWYEQPKDFIGLWTFHQGKFSQDRGGAQMFAYDVNNDGQADVLSAIHAHEWGLAWYQQSVKDGKQTFIEHKIMGDRSQEKQYNVAFSQPHAMVLADINGDGLQDIITGKRRWAHGPKGDVEPSAAPVVYWFELTRTASGKVKYIPHLIDDNSGVGVQIAAKDVNADGRIDVLTTSKLGTFVFLNEGPK
ncbi:MAG: cysteine protease [Blastopirellula sp.]|nr:MAG: cysteine protease [Blastopirellula sp.]